MKVSIIIPYYNSYSYLVGLLPNLIINTQFSDYEVIIVNDGSEDFKSAISFIKDLKSRFNIELKYIDRRENKLFAYTCNEGADHAKGDFLLFLNIDTIPLKNWLCKMIEVYNTMENSGIVGSKLIFLSSNLIQHIGGAIDFSGKPFHLYKNTLSDLSFINKIREVSHSTAASMLVSKKDFNALGGFDDKKIKHTYEDTDLCFKMRFKLGKKVYVSPESTLFHFENVTGKTSDYSEKSLKILRKRWKKHLKPDEYLFYENDGFSRELVKLFEKLYSKDFNVIYQFIRQYKLKEIEEQNKFLNSENAEEKILSFLSAQIKKNKLLFINEQQVFKLLINDYFDRKTREELTKEYVKRSQKNKFFTNLYNYASLYIEEDKIEKAKELFTIILEYKKYLRKDFIGKVYYKLATIEDDLEKKEKLLHKSLKAYEAHTKAKLELEKIKKRK